jgi:hypothetical protein
MREGFGPLHDEVTRLLQCLSENETFREERNPQKKKTRRDKGKNIENLRIEEERGDVVELDAVVFAHADELLQALSLLLSLFLFLSSPFAHFLPF